MRRTLLRRHCLLTVDPAPGRFMPQPIMQSKLPHTLLPARTRAAP
jgi:hypothetical protein